MQRHFARLGLNTRPDGSPPRGVRPVRGRRARTTCGPATPCTARPIAGRKTYLFAFIDDHSRAAGRLSVGAVARTRCASRRRCASALAARGVPRPSTSTTARAFVVHAAAAGLRQPGHPPRCTVSPRPAQGRGKIERFFETVRDQFLVEVDARGVADLAELNRLFTAWVETVYHRRVHTETGAGAARAVPRRRRAGAADPGAAARGVPVVRDAHRDQDRDRVACTATPTRSTPPWSGRRVELRLRPLRPDRRRGPLPGPSRWAQASPSRSAATPTPRPGPRPPRRRRRPASTTSACSPPAATPSSPSPSTTPSCSAPRALDHSRRLDHDDDDDRQGDQR